MEKFTYPSSIADSTADDRYLLYLFCLKGELKRYETIFETENPLKMMKNDFYFTLKALFVLKIFKFFSLLFDHVEKTARLEK